MNIGQAISETVISLVNHEKNFNELYINEFQQAAQEGAKLGAKWQRDQLRTDEAVERVARSLLHSDWPADEGARDYHWKHFADSYREKAHATIDTLLGEEP